MNEQLEPARQFEEIYTEWNDPIKQQERKILKKRLERIQFSKDETGI